MATVLPGMTPHKKGRAGEYAVMFRDFPVSRAPGHVPLTTAAGKDCLIQGLPLLAGRAGRPQEAFKRTRVEISLSPDLALRHMPDVLNFKYGTGRRGWTPRLHKLFGYSSPDDWYEATLFHLIGPDTDWLDVGCGRHVFPNNKKGARHLAATCRVLIGVDPSDNIHQNQIVHERNQCMLQDYRTDRRFDLVTMRMVAEHVEDPAAAVAALSRLIRPGGLAVIYTVDKFSPVSRVAAATPMPVHHFAKRVLWGGSAQDTFPVAYRMNTRSDLCSLFRQAGFREESFTYLDDCRTLGQWLLSAFAELALWKVLRAAGLRYPEGCLLGLYRKAGD
jgi:SAM-dependent methyltransferase